MGGMATTRQRTPEHKAAIGAALRAKWQDPEWRATRRSLDSLLTDLTTLADGEGVPMTVVLKRAIASELARVRNGDGS